MGTNALTYVQSIMIELGDNSTSATLQAIWLRWLTDCVQDIYRKFQWDSIIKKRAALPTVADQKEYELEAGAFQLLDLRDTEAHRPIQKKEESWLIDQNYDLDQSGKPLYWYPFDYSTTDDVFRFGLWPVPGEIYELEMLQAIRLSALLTDDDDIPLPFDFFGPLEEYLKWHFYDEEGDPQKALIHKQIYDQKLASLKSKEDESDDLVMGFADVPRNGRRRFYPALFPDRAQGS